MKNLLPAALLLIFSLSVFGQTKSVEQLQAEIKTFKKSGKYKVSYDKFKDITLVETEKYLMNYFGVSTGFTFQGNQLKEQPKEIALIFTAYGSKYSGREGWRFLKDSRLILLIDNERAEIGEGGRDSSFARGMFGESLTKEKIFYLIPIEVFEKMSKAKSVEFQISKEEGKFNAAMLEMFKNLYSLAKL